LDDSKLLGLALGFARRMARMTADELARRAGCTVQSISRYENGALRDHPYETIRPLFVAMGHPEEMLDLLVGVLRLIQRPLDDGGGSWWLTPEHRAGLRKVAVLSGLAWAEDAEAWLLASFERALEERDRKDAAELCEAVRRRPAEERRAVLAASPGLHTWAACSLLCDWSLRSAAIRPQQALAWAELAVVAAERVPGSEALRARLLAYASAYLANALRVGGRLVEAHQRFGEVWRLWELGAEAEAGPLPVWRLYDLEASLRRDRREFDRELELLSRALDVAPAEVAGRILINRGFTLEQMGRIDAAIEALEAAKPFVDRECEPRLWCYLRLNLAVCHYHFERWEISEALLAESRALAFEKDLNLGTDWTRTRWLSAKVAAGQGRLAEAVRELETLREEFLAQENELEVALVSLELAVLHLSAGRAREVQSLARQIAPAFERLGVLREALASFQVFFQAAEQEAATAELALRVLSGFQGSQRFRNSRETLPNLGHSGSVSRVRSTAVGIPPTASIHDDDHRRVGNAPSIGIHSAASIRALTRGSLAVEAQAIGVKGASQIQSDHHQESPDPLQRTPGRGGDRTRAGSLGHRSEQRQAQDTGHEERGTPGGSRHRTAPFEGVDREPPRPAGTLSPDRLPHHVKKSTGNAKSPDDATADADLLTEPALLVRWLGEIPGGTLKALEERTGIDSSALSRHQRGKAVPHQRTVERMAAGLGLPHALVENGLRPMARTVVDLLKGRGPWEEIASRATPAELAGRHAELLGAAWTAFRAEQGLPPEVPEPAASAEKGHIEDLFERLTDFTASERHQALQEGTAFHDVRLVPRLCEESRSTAIADPAAALAWADLALALAERVARNPGEHRRLRGYAGAFRANALRLGSVGLLAAKDEFDRAWQEWTAGEGAIPEDILPGWRLLYLQSSFESDLCRFEASLERLQQARASCPPEAAGSLLVKLAFTQSKMGLLPEAVATLREAEPKIDAIREPRLRYSLLANLALDWSELGHPEEAALLLPEIEALSAAARRPLDPARLDWIRSRIEIDLGRLEEAAASLDRSREAFLEHGSAYEAALTTVELAALLLRMERRSEIPELVVPLQEVLADPATAMKEETAAVVGVFCRAARAGAATPELVKGLLPYLRGLGG
jgi:tetratricopeptide (TPR) repeat protein